MPKIGCGSGRMSLSRKSCASCGRSSDTCPPDSALDRSSSPNPSLALHHSKTTLLHLALFLFHTHTQNKWNELMKRELIACIFYHRDQKARGRCSWVSLHCKGPISSAVHHRRSCTHDCRMHLGTCRTTYSDPRLLCCLWPTPSAPKCCGAESRHRTTAREIGQNTLYKFKKSFY